MLLRALPLVLCLSLLVVLVVLLVVVVAAAAVVVVVAVWFFIPVPWTRPGSPHSANGSPRQHNMEDSPRDESHIQRRREHKSCLDVGLLSFSRSLFSRRPFDKCRKMNPRAAQLRGCAPQLAIRPISLLALHPTNIA